MEGNASPEVAMAAGVVLLLIGGALLTWALRLFLRQRREMKEHTRTTGIVIENRATEGMDNSTFYCPVVEFTTATKRSIRVQCLGSSQIQYPVGASVPVLYNSMRPQEAGIAGEAALGAVLLMVLASFPIGLGLLFLALGLFGKWSGGFRPLSP